MFKYLSSFGQLGRARAGIRILCYHGVVAKKTDQRLERNFHLIADFKRHIGFLRWFNVIGLADVLEYLREPAKPGTPAKPAAVITFDDGYENNLIAHELLCTARLPFSVFSATGSVGSGDTIWTVELSLLLLHGQARQVAYNGQVWPLGSRMERERAFQSIRQEMKALPSAERLSTMVFVRSQFPPEETRRLLDEFPSMRMMSWQQVAQLAAAGVEIGSHGVDHEIHHGAQPAAVRCRELTESKKAIETRLARTCRFFAFPNGHFVKSSPDELRLAGYELGLTTWEGSVTRGVNPLLLPRIEPRASLFKFGQSFFCEPTHAG